MCMFEKLFAQERGVYKPLIQALCLIVKKTTRDRHCGYSLILKTQSEKNYDRTPFSSKASISILVLAPAWSIIHLLSIMPGNI